MKKKLLAYLSLSMNLLRLSIMKLCAELTAINNCTNFSNTDYWMLILSKVTGQVCLICKITYLTIHTFTKHLMTGLSTYHIAHRDIR